MSTSTVRTAGAGAVTAVITLSCVVISLMQTFIVPIIPKLPQLLDTDASNASWAVTATLLAAAVVTPIAGRLGDMYGKRRVIIASLVLVVVGSVLCAVSDSLLLVITGRALQGLATGVIPVGISFLRDVLPAERVGGSIALVSAALGVGGAVGLPASAAIVQYADWHVLFWVAAVLGVICLALVVVLLQESPNQSPGRFDILGASGLAVGLVCLLLAATKGGSWGWTSASILGLFAGGVVILLVWGAYELRVAQPLVDLRVAARRPVLFTNLASLMVGFAMYATSLVLPQLLQSPSATGYGLGQSVLAAGLALAPSGLVMMAFAPLSARITARHGARTTLLTGLCVIGVGYGIGLGLMAEVWQIIVMSMIVSAGVGIAYAASPALIMGAVPVTETASANGINSLMRSVGTSSSSAVMAAMLANMTVQLGPVSVPTEHGFRMTYVVAMLAAVVGIGFTFLIPRVRRAAAPQNATPAQATGTPR
ncbi:MFS transporter [Streptomyces sp. B-S-A8]|uniref:MFS transporter n=1 Tax=Streptomyces solicavernae TaxID=3043614 RepID=A0ABT6RZG6_9ACTN|nr:MFS transporter [Streptomyces sp. B-S-A8]MDI3389123.1 MFS transporter [Streptomyces sp. B-S-A8]